jgi:ferric-dicitrate binding protein FerR (iron transport regulator)
MTQQEFNDLSKRYLEGGTTEDEEKRLMEWFQAQPALTPPDMTPQQKNAFEKQMWQHIRAQIPPVWTVSKGQLAWLSGMAACLILGVFWLQHQQTLPSIQQVFSSQTPQQVGIEVTNTTASEQEVKLEDGTVVLLQQNSRIVYDKSFNKTKRVVYLTGEAFFKVKRDETKPFVVHTGDLVTEVLGTSFRIKPNTNSNEIEVAVATGRVSVYTEKTNRPAERNGIILTPNQRVIFDIHSKNITPGIVDAPVPIESAKVSIPPLVFKGASLEEVLSTLSQLYGIEFVMANPKANDCRITADLNGLSMFTQLELVCKSIDATYQKRGTVVFIDGDGC